VKELLKSGSTCQSYAQMKKGPFFVTHSVVLVYSNLIILVLFSFLTIILVFVLYRFSFSLCFLSHKSSVKRKKISTVY